MSKIYALCLLLLSLITFGQEKTPMRYIIKVTTESGLVDTLDIDNYNKKSNIPAPVVKEKCIREGKPQTGCIYYDGEYSWTGVKSIEIVKIEYFDKKEAISVKENNSNQEIKSEIDDYSLKTYGRTEGEYQKMFAKLPERATKKIKIYNFLIGKHVTKNIIWFPRQEAINRQKYLDGKSRDFFEVNKEKPENIVKEDKSEETKTVDWKALKSKQYAVYEVFEFDSFKKIENSGVKMSEDNFIVPSGINEEDFEKKQIEKETPEYDDLKLLKLKIGYYIIGKGFDENNTKHFRVLPLKFNTQEE